MIAGRLADAATAKASATRNAMLSFCAGIASAMAIAPMTNGGDPGHPDLVLLGDGWPFLKTPL